MPPESEAGRTLAGMASRGGVEEIKVPGQRVQIVGHGAHPHDLTAPIDWLMTSTGSPGA